MRKNLEDKIQSSIVTAVKYLYPKSILAAVPNGGKRNLKEAVRFKQQGVYAGFADLIFIHKGNIMFFEVKAPNGKQSELQKEFETKITNQGFKYHIVKSVDEVLQIIIESSI